MPDSSSTASQQFSKLGFEEEYPFDSHFLDLDGVKYHYIDEGEGQPFLMVHGNPTWSFAFRNFVREFSKTHRVIAVDHIGCGFSDKPQNYSYTLTQHIQNLSRLIQSLDLQQITLMVHDWGGAIGFGAAIEEPRRFERFVVLNTSAFRGKKIPLRIAVCRLPILGAIAVRGLNLFAGAALKMTIDKPQRMTTAVKNGYLAPYNNWANRVAVHRFVQDIPVKKSHPSYATVLRIEEGLAQFAECPLLLLWGMRDWCFHYGFLKEFQNRFPKCETEAYEDAGHYVFEDAHERMIPRIRRFFGENPLKSH